MIHRSDALTLTEVNHISPNSGWHSHYYNRCWEPTLELLREISYLDGSDIQTLRPSKKLHTTFWTLCCRHLFGECLPSPPTWVHELSPPCLSSANCWPHLWIQSLEVGSPTSGSHLVDGEEYELKCDQQSMFHGRLQYLIQWRATANGTQQLGGCYDVHSLELVTELLHPSWSSTPSYTELISTTYLSNPPRPLCWIVTP